MTPYTYKAFHIYINSNLNIQILTLFEQKHWPQKWYPVLLTSNNHFYVTEQGMEAGSHKVFWQCNFAKIGWLYLIMYLSLIIFTKHILHQCNSITSGWWEAIYGLKVSCSNPHSNGSTNRTWVRCARLLGHDTTQNIDFSSKKNPNKQNPKPLYN